MTSIGESWCITIEARSDYAVNLSCPVVKIEIAPIAGRQSRLYQFVTVKSILVGDLLLTRHSWLGKDLDQLNCQMWPSDSPASPITIIFSNISLVPISFLLSVDRTLLGRDGAPWPE